ncbi:SBBP repeat-containing protein [Chloroflexus sp.]|uniref:SBBP repeat-containing protein n=1 Tax=Chloroflexus sp. TaxID=1904827 RepID=UPI002ACE9601|nr:SBBP repeat-containing protein [Chloroflexus sp.]
MGSTIFFTPQEIVMALPTTVPTPTLGLPPRGRAPLSATQSISFTYLRQRYLGATPAPTLSGTTLLPGRSQVYRGDVAGKWVRDIPMFASLVYVDLYPGIDLQYAGDGRQLKSTYTIASGADPALIRWRYTGARDLQVDTTGNLIVTVPRRGLPTAAPIELVEAAPIAWQEIAGARVAVDVRFQVENNNTVQFALGQYDPTYPLIIDPTLTYSSYLGGSGTDAGEAIAVDADGSIYVAGTTYSSDFPTQNPNDPTYNSPGYTDVFVTKLSSDGASLIYSTYLGGDDSDFVSGLAVDDSGNAHITGGTDSSNFPQQSGLTNTWGTNTDNAFVARFTASGTLDYSTLLGGTFNDYGSGIAVDNGDNAYVVGSTNSSDFPTANAYQSTKAGSTLPDDAFVTKLEWSGSSLSYGYSTYLGGSNDDLGGSIAIDSSGNAYIEGWTYSTNFPTANAFDSTLGGTLDTFVTKLAASGSSLVYSTYIGGSNNDLGYDIAVDGSGHAYVTGFTYSTNFPLSNALDGTLNGTDDAFVTKLSSSGSSLVYSTYLGGSDSETGYGIALDSSGSASIVGYTRSSDFPTAFPFQLQNLGSGSGLNDAFVVKLTAAGDALVYGTYLGGSGGDSGHDIARNGSGTAYVTGQTYSADFPTVDAFASSRAGTSDVFVATINDAQLPGYQNWLPESPPLACSQECRGGPINTRSGNLWTTATDLVVVSPGPRLAWERSYASQSTDDLSGTLGIGWHHPYATRVITSGAALGEPGAIFIVSPKGNRLRFAELGGGQFQANPGVYETLILSSGVYTLTLRDQSQQQFDAVTGRLTGVRDPQGRDLTLSYDGSGRLTAIRDAARPTERYLELGYSGSATLIQSVTDGTRTVQYGYDSNADLTSATDVMGRTTTYTYQSHLLTRITDPLGQIVEETAYETPYLSSSRAISQTLQDGRRLELAYLDTTTVITTTGADNQQDVEIIDYAPSNTVAAQTLNGITVQEAAHDGNFSPGQLADANGNTTTTRFNRAGQLERLTNALGETTAISYDSANRPITITDTLNRQTTMAYDANNNLIRLTTGITTAFSLGFTTLYTYTNSHLSEQQGPNGVVMRYDRNADGQVITATVGYGTSAAQVSTYGYDPLGRVVTTTVGVGTALARADVTVYNNDNTVARTIQNYVDGSFTAANPDEDLITEYGYDDLGRQVWVKNPLGRYDVTHYNADGRVDWTAQNLTPLQVDTDGLPIFQSFVRTAPDQNVATLYAYDGLGRTTLITQTGILTGTFDPSTRTFSSATTRTTRTEYDALSRPITITLNYQPGVPAGPDVNVQTLTQYDDAGNVIGQRDAFGRWTVTDYDALNRPITVTLNYENGDPLTVDAGNTAWATITDTDQIQVTAYTADGQIDYVIDQYVDGSFDPAEPDRDRKTVYVYDALGRLSQTIQNYHDGDPGTNPYAPNPDRYDTDRITETAYDSAGRLQGSQDPLGRWVSQQYDSLSRVGTVVQNCRDGSGTPVASGCVAFSSTTPDRNVPVITRYDALGRAWESENALGQVDRTTFDGVGRTATTTRNYVNGGPSDSDTNVTTRQGYDALGRTTVITDALNVATFRAYDALGRTSVITDAVGRASRRGYDGIGTQRWLETPDGRFTVLQTDGLGRVIATIVNYDDGVVGGSEPADQDLITQTVYDAVGRRVQTIDPTGRVTAFTYDLRDKLLSVTENVASGTCPTAPCNVTTSYHYDRAGNRLSITDANNHTRTFAYDAADQQIATTDPLNQVTAFRYDSVGRLTLKDDPRGSDYDVTYSYDDADRPTGMSAVELDASITMAYNALGWRTSLGDGTGSTSFSHDDLGRITGLTAPNTGSVGYAYNARGERTQLTYPNSVVLDYTYWNDGRMREVRQGSSVLASYTYDNAGRPAATTLASGVIVTSASYDDADRLSDLHTQVGSTTRTRFTYTLDRLGLRTAVSEVLGSSTRSVSYTYDGLLRLTGATESGVTSNSYSYGYDLAGNRTSATVNGSTITTTYNAANQITSTGYVYDAAGNLTNSPGITTTYDALNRSTSATDGTTTSNSVYNGDGILVETSNGTVTTRYAQDLAGPLSQILRITQGSSGGTVLWGREKLASVSSVLRLWEIGDALNSVRATLTDAGTVFTTTSYDPWGVPQSALTTPFGFTGELQDSASGLVYLRARWYDASRGRFHQRDPFAGWADQPYSFHYYQYAYSNSVVWSDPTGRQTQVNPRRDSPEKCYPWEYFDPILRECLQRLSPPYPNNPTDATSGSSKTGSKPRDSRSPLIDVEEPDIDIGIGDIGVDVEPEYEPPTGLSKGTRAGIGAFLALCLANVLAQAVGPNVPLPAPPDDWRQYERTVLVLGENPSLDYATGLAAKHPDWKIIASTYGDGSNSQVVNGAQSSLPNLTVVDNVDARRLHEGSYTKTRRFDDVAFNAPRGFELDGSAGWVDETNLLIEGTLSSARNVLLRGGRARFSSSPNMPGTQYLRGFRRAGPPGYSRVQVTNYQEDVNWFVEEYRPQTLDGRRLGTKTLQWYIFIKQN